MQHKEIERSHVLDHALAYAGVSGLPRHHRKHVVKNRFVTPSHPKTFKTVTTKDGRSYEVPTGKQGKWPCGHHKNNHHK